MFYHRTLGGSRHESCPLILFSSLLYLSGVALFSAAWRADQEVNLIWTHDRANPSQLQNEKAVWSESIPEASMESFSQMLMPFAAPTVLQYDEKGLERVQWLSYLYEENGGGEAVHGRWRDEATNRCVCLFVCALLCLCVNVCDFKQGI